MLNPSKSDCVAVLLAAQRAAGTGDVVQLSGQSLGLSRNSLNAAASFLIERGCFERSSGVHGSYQVGGLSLQGRLRLEQLVHG